MRPEPLPPAAGVAPPPLRDQLRRGLRWLFVADRLPENPPPPVPRDGTGWLRWLFGRESPPEAPAERSPGGGSFLAWLLRPERLETPGEAPPKGDRS